MEKERKEERRAEVLAPAGSYESMKAAFAAGADAVYIGGSRFGARAFAQNLEEGKLCQAIDYAHLHRRKLYLTVNTLIKEQEIEELADYLLPYYQCGLDGVIVQDFGAMACIRECFPDLPIHASTQMTITGVYGAKWLKERGASRVVTARELSLKEIQAIHQQVDIEIESFVHGALCYCYSGQCLMSSFIGGRSGNRGRCAQPCRLPYEVWQNGKQVNGKNERYVLSLKDLCTLRQIPDILEAGVYSLKIEGRMKSPRYTAGVVSIYRKYVDQYRREGREGYQVNPEDERLLLDLFDRGGFTDGYYQKQNGRDMVALKEKPAFREGNPAFFACLDQEFVHKDVQVPIFGFAEFEPEKEAKLTLQVMYEDGKMEKAMVYGQVVQAALSQPITEEKIRKQLQKTGNSPFYFKDLQIQVSGSGFLPVQAVNALRRKGFEELERQILKKRQRRGWKEKKEAAGEKEFTQEGMQKEEVPLFIASLEEEHQFVPALGCAEVDEIYLDADGFPAERWEEMVKSCHQRKKKCSLLMPCIFRQKACAYFNQNREFLLRAGFDRLVVRSLEEVGWLNETGISLPLVFDASLYTWNHFSSQVIKEMGADRMVMPLELSSRELKAKGCQGEEIFVYGRLPMMVSAQCVKKTIDGCRKKREVLWLKDRMGKWMPVKPHCTFCYSVICNASPLSLLGQEELAKELKPSAFRLGFTVESSEEVQDILRAFADVFCCGKKTELVLPDYTRGAIKRGVE